MQFAVDCSQVQTNSEFGSVLFTVMNCILWCFYGLPIVKKDNLLVLTINAIGLVIELLYLTVLSLPMSSLVKRFWQQPLFWCPRWFDYREVPQFCSSTPTS
ncbi:hypothetical protein V6N13_001437 [Hibiscus sabdariffa]|uniref:Uncharacterized protein n=1 Tax=Hibiscus sabdariffa TaxID=183260 RepID=A0ABR2G8D0_9ROSI